MKVSFLGLLGLLFIGLKLTGHVAWSWWLVLLPLYGPLAVALAVVVVTYLVAGVLLFLVGLVEALAAMKAGR